MNSSSQHNNLSHGAIPFPTLPPPNLKIRQVFPFFPVGTHIIRHTTSPPTTTRWNPPLCMRAKSVCLRKSEHFSEAKYPTLSHCWLHRPAAAASPWRVWEAKLFQLQLTSFPITPEPWNCTHMHTLTLGGGTQGVKHTALVELRLRFVCGGNR